MLPDFLNWLRDADPAYAAAIWFALAAAGLFVASYLLAVVLGRLRRAASSSRSLWDDALLASLRWPSQALLWTLGAVLAYDWIFAPHAAQTEQALRAARLASVIVALAWLGMAILKNIERPLFARLEADARFSMVGARAGLKALRILVLVAGVLMALDTFGYDISSLLVLGGAGGIAVGLAAKDLLANFFGAIMLYLDRPFVEGETIRLPEKDVSGTVENVGWRLTRIRNYDRRPVYLPNALFSQALVENITRMSHRRINERIGVRYDDLERVPAIVADLRAMLESHPQVDSREAQVVNVTAFGASSVDILVYVLTRATDWQAFNEVKHDVLLRCADIVARHGGEIAFPTRTLHVRPPAALEVELGAQAAAAAAPPPAGGRGGE